VNTPDITPAQIAAWLTGLGGQAVAFGLLNGHTEQLVVSIGTISLAAVWKIADAIIRHGRSSSLHGAQAAAINQEAALTPLSSQSPATH
jgi:hypothetical protein